MLESQDASQETSDDTTTTIDEASSDDTDATEDSSTNGDDGDADRGEAIGTTRAQCEAENGNVRIRIDVISLERNGDLVELSMVMTNEAPEADVEASDNDELYWYAHDRFGEGTYDLRDIGLVDQAEQKMYLPVLDSADECLCTGVRVVGERLYPSHSVDLVASFGGVPEDVDTVDLHKPDFPAITGLGIEQ